MIKQDRGQAAIDFINCLTTSRGEPFKLRKWQENIVKPLLGRTRPDGLRQYTDCGIWLPRGNGKTELCAAIAVERLFRDHRKRGEIYCAATTRDQAGLLFNAARAMIEDNPTLHKLVEITPSRKQILHKERGTVFRALAAESGPLHGLRPTVVFVDELHCAKDREVFTALQTGLGKCPEPLMITITTSGVYNRHSLEWEHYDYACKVRDKVIKHPSYFPVIYEAPKDARWDLVKTWRACNPALGDFRNLDEMKRLCARAKKIPRLEADFRRLYLNQHTAQKEKWLSQEDWNECQVDRITADGPWLGGCDLSAKQDLTSLALTCKTDNGYAIKSWNWIPEDTALDHEQSDRVPYLTWHNKGHIEFTPGDRIDQEFILQRIGEICQEHDCRKVAFDPHQAEWFFQMLPVRYGIEAIEAQQNFRTFTEPCREVESCLASRTLQHEGNEALTWMIGNTEVKTTSDGLIRPVKGTHHARIDGVVAMLISIALSLAPQEEPKPAIF